MILIWMLESNCLILQLLACMQLESLNAFHPVLCFAILCCEVGNRPSSSGATSTAAITPEPEFLEDQQPRTSLNPFLMQLSFLNSASSCRKFTRSLRRKKWKQQTLTVCISVFF